MIQHAQARQCWLDVADLRLSLLAWGPDDAPPLLALHGWLDNANSFVPLANHLPNRRLLALELPGHGYSSPLPASADYHLFDAIVLLEALLDTLGIEQVECIGHSMGAVLALYFAIAAPRRVSHLRLIDALGPPTEPAENAGERLVRASRQRRLLAKRSLHPLPDVKAAMTLRQRRGYLPQDAALAELLLARSLTPCEGGEGLCWRHDPRLVLDSTTYMSEPALLSLLDQLHTPTRLLLPDQGLLARRSNRRERFSRPSDLRVISVPGGHYVHMEEPSACVEWLGFS